MKILFITNYFPNANGLQDAIFLYWRAKELINEGHQVSVLKWDQDLKDVFEKDYSLSEISAENFKEDIHIKRVNNISLWNPFYKRRLYQWIKDNFDIVHFHWLWSMTVFPTIAKWKIPYIVTCHGSDIYRLGEPSWDQLTKNAFTIFNLAFVQRINRYVIGLQIRRLNQANHVIFVSSDIQRAALSKSFSGHSSSVIPNGINLNNFYPTKSSSDLPPSKKLVGYVGLLSTRKRSDTLIQLFRHIKDRCQDVHFVVIGEGSLRSQMESDCNSLDLVSDVLFTGKVSVAQVCHYMQKMDLFILPSREEAFGCVIKEAQACGTQVVGTNVGGIPEAIGDGGRVVDEGPDFEKRFATTVCDLLETPISPEIIAKSVSNCSWEMTCRKELDVYHSILDK